MSMRATPLNLPKDKLVSPFFKISYYKNLPAELTMAIIVQIWRGVYLNYCCDRELVLSTTNYYDVI